MVRESPSVSEGFALIADAIDARLKKKFKNGLKKNISDTWN